MSSQEASLASPSVIPGDEEARMMTATSGRKCSALSPKSVPLGSLVRTLLESSRWSSRARFLQWQVKPLYSTRATEFSDIDRNNPSPSNEFAETLRVLDMPSSRYLFQLVPLEPRTEETECLLLQTSTAVQICEPPEKMMARAKHNGYKNGTKYGSLTSQIMYDPKMQPFLKTPCTADSYTDQMKSKGVSGTSGTLAQEVMSGYEEKHRGLILPTPNACDYNTTWTEEAKQACLERRKQEGKTAYPSKFNALKQMAVEGLLPTPTAIEGEKYTNTYNPDSQMGQSLSALAGSGMLPTPRVSGEESYETRAKRKGHAAAMTYLESAVDFLTKSESGGQTSHLSPLFTEEMMGFPFLWTTLPFLGGKTMSKSEAKNSQNGEQNPSKPTATP